MEAPSLEKAYQAYKDKGVRFLGVFVSSNDEEIRKFAETYHQTFPVGKDTDVAKSLNAKAIPETVFITREGQIIERHRDIITFDELVTGIEKLL